MRRQLTTTRQTQLAALLAAVAAAQGTERTCTGLSAQWCPVHGTCTCPDQWPIPGTTQMSGPMVGQSCPLHSPTSLHAE
jgi:hypothetical protein